jgi:hypothetical protein
MSDKIDITLVSHDDYLKDYFKNIIKCSLINEHSMDFLKKYPNIKINLSEQSLKPSFDITQINGNLIVYLIEENDILNENDKYTNLLDFIDFFNQNKDENILVKMFIIINSCKKNYININKIKEMCQYVYILPLKNTYVYRYLYWYTKNNIDFDIDLQDVNNEIKDLVGNICFKNKICNLEPKNKIKLLFDEYDFEEIYTLQMKDYGFNLLTNDIDNYVDMSYNNIVLNGMKKMLDDIKNDNILLINKNILILNLIESIEINKYIYNEFIEYLMDTYVINLDNYIELNNLSYDDINSINLINKKLNDKYNINIFENTEILDKINSTKNLMIVEKFKSTFDLKLIDEFKNQHDVSLINLNVINEAILYNISSWSFENYLNYSEQIIKYFSEIDHLAHLSKYIKHFVNQTILTDYMSLKDNRQCNYIEFIINSYDYKLENNVNTYDEYSNNVEKIIQFNVQVNRLFQYIIKKNNKIDDTKTNENKSDENKTLIKTTTKKQ